MDWPAITRRQALAGASSAAFAAALQGCEIFRQPLSKECVNDDRITSRCTPLTVDTHVHVFNASDLQVGKFFDLVLPVDPDLGPTIRSTGDILQEIGWTTAPDGNTELARLKSIREAVQACDKARIDAQYASDAQEGYALGQATLKNALRQARAGEMHNRAGRSRALLDEMAAQIESLPESLGEYEAERARVRLRGRSSEIEIRSTLDFIFRNFQYRYVNTLKYLKTYSIEDDRKIDLIVAHLVDYDWPLAKGEKTYTSFEVQVDVMEEISVLTGGRIHCFAPFDPLRAVAHRLTGTGFSPHRLVHNAIERQGFIGVKLYPPMGFAAYGNAARPRGFWQRAWLPELFARDDIGALIDDELRKLYEWCLPVERGGHDVPIMAHTNRSLGPHVEFIDLAGAEGWKLALETFEGLRIDFGHFGATDEAGGDKAAAFAQLMTRELGSIGENAYADTGYFMETVDDPQGLRRRLRELLRNTAAGEGAPLAERLMYGTDWEMISRESSDFASYFRQFQTIAAALDEDVSIGPPGMFSRQVFGSNAAKFLGLHRGQENRRRLDRFYSRKGVPDPVWMAKVDASPDPACAPAQL